MIFKCFKSLEMSDPLNYSESRWNGWNGNECVYKKDYQKAIEYYNIAIDLYPLEYRYFVNRSFCFDQLQTFQLALNDAERALLLQPDWGKCYYRKARALKGLKRFEESELCLQKVIQLEGNDCKEAQHELRTLRDPIPVLLNPINNKSPDLNVSQIDTKNDQNLEIDDKNVNNVTLSEVTNKKLILNERIGEKNLLKELSDFLLNKNLLLSNQTVKSLEIKPSDKNVTKIEQKIGATDNKLNKTVNNVSKICNELKTKNSRRNTPKGMDDIVEIWDDSRNQWETTANRPQNIIHLKSNRKQEPTNIWKFKGLYISNIKPLEETKQSLYDILCDFGKVTLIDIIGQSEMAIINFDNPESPRIAMSRLQGVHIPRICVNNQKLRIRFRPLNDSMSYPSINATTERQLNGECYFWRTTGCTHTKFCKLRHIAVNKGVDLQPWMQNNKNKFKRQHRNRFEFA